MVRLRCEKRHRDDSHDYSFVTSMSSVIVNIKTIGQFRKSSTDRVFRGNTLSVQNDFPSDNAWKAVFASCLIC